MAKIDFTDIIRGRFDSTLGEVGYGYTESIYDGYFDNCQIVYSSGSIRLYFLRDRGSVSVACGFHIKNDSYRSWPLQVVIEYLVSDTRCASFVSPMLQELDSCDVFSDGFVQLLKECMPKVRNLFLHSDLSTVDHELSRLSKAVSDRNIEKLIFKSRPSQK